MALIQKWIFILLHNWGSSRNAAGSDDDDDMSFMQSIVIHTSHYFLITAFWEVVNAFLILFFPLHSVTLSETMVQRCTANLQTSASKCSAASISVCTVLEHRTGGEVTAHQPLWCVNSAVFSSNLFLPVVLTAVTGSSRMPALSPALYSVTFQNAKH